MVWWTSWKFWKAGLLVSDCSCGSMAKLLAKPRFGVFCPVADLQTGGNKVPPVHLSRIENGAWSHGKGRHTGGFKEMDRAVGQEWIHRLNHW